MRRATPVLALAVSAAIALSGCGGSDDEDAGGTTTAPAGTTTAAAENKRLSSASWSEYVTARDQAQAVNQKAITTFSKCSDLLARNVGSEQIQQCFGTTTTDVVTEGQEFLTTLAANLGGAPYHDSEMEREAAEMWLTEQIHGRENAEAVLLEGHPAEAAVDWAREAGCDVMVAAHNSGRVERVLLGSFAKHLVDHAPCAVLLIPPDEAAA